MSHTPGPWMWRKSDGTLRAKDGNAIINPTLLKSKELRDSVNKDEDAALIAAAPDLLAALEGLYEAECTDGEMTDTAEAARAAIAKAKGEADAR